ncbi:uncharacterized protein LOC120435247 isoform X4 [Oreochromis aureus]|uniref:uncharacterized protein LOC120435247 isoform X4 n=1 Tax=Oreochromis aureus TaxID=47969 RepID=UPI0019537970|nr:uncharacterized protein LOC120435247 isoform X4 [Oreochromis aureus]
MKHTLVCFIFLTALQDGNTGLVKAQTLPRRAEEGGNITVACRFYLSGSRKLFSSTTSTPNGTLRPFSASVFLSSASTPPTTQSLSSTSGSSTPSSASSETKDARSDVLIYVGLILVVMIVVLSAALLIFYLKSRTTKPRGPPVETEYADMPADNLCYAEVEFSHIPVTSSAPCGEATDVVYSMPQVDLSTAIHTKDSSPPLYSTVSSL